MIDPTGPRPTSVYWRRRVLALGACAVAVLVAVWIIGALAGGDGRQPAASGAARQQPVLASTRQSEPPSAGPATPSASGQPSSAAAAPESTSQGPPPSPSPPPAPQPCPDAVVHVVAEVDQPEYRVGQRPAFRLLIGNVSQVTCTRDISKQLRELVVTSIDGTARLWSSNDCYTRGAQEVRAVQSGETLAFSVSWAGRTSAPGCPSGRSTVPAGDYLVVPKLGPLTGAAVPFRLS